jgi:hypothetical protein
LQLLTQGSHRRQRSSASNPDRYRLRGLLPRICDFNRLDIAANHGLKIFTYAAETGSRSDEALKLLDSWAATLDAAESPSASEQR